MDLLQIRRTILTAVASDDVLADILVLKGGNALELIHKIGDRASVDLDFSVATDFPDPSEIEERLARALDDRFDAVGLQVFDFRFGPRPSNRAHGAEWGGYLAEFKLIPKELATELGGELDKMRPQAQATGPRDQRRFKLEISAFEHVTGKQSVTVDHYSCFVYSVDMIAAEKLRAVCQQSPDYPLQRNRTARARDFYDIYVTVTEGGVKFRSVGFQSMVRSMFEAKRVNLKLLNSIDDQRNFHRTDWPSVEVAVRRTLREFDFYFDEVLAFVQLLEPLWVE